MASTITPAVGAKSSGKRDESCSCMAFPVGGPFFAFSLAIIIPAIIDVLFLISAKICSAGRRLSQSANSKNIFPITSSAASPAGLDLVMA